MVVAQCPRRGSPCLLRPIWQTLQIYIFQVVVQRIAKWNGKDIPANFIHQMVRSSFFGWKQCFQKYKKEKRAWRWKIFLRPSLLPRKVGKLVINRLKNLFRWIRRLRTETSAPTQTKGEQGQRKRQRQRRQHRTGTNANQRWAFLWFDSVTYQLLFRVIELLQYKLNGILIYSNFLFAAKWAVTTKKKGV